MKFDVFNPGLKEWEKTAGYSKRRILKKRDGFDVVDYSPEFTGETSEKYRIVFFSDLHFDENFPARKFIGEINDLKPDWVLFGGDLTTYACHIKGAVNMLARLKARKGKICVLGNWDIRRRRWYPEKVLENKYREAGFTLLVNKTLSAGNITFYGMDDFKSGTPALIPHRASGINILISHNPDAIISEKIKTHLKDFDIILSGHTHGGQIRIPFIGSLLTSSIYWRKFDYGLFRHKTNKTKMIVSSGLGYTGIKLRIACRPEIIIIDNKKALKHGGKI